MEIKEMLKLAYEGISASDVLALNKAGYTPEIMEELKNNDNQAEDIKAQAEENKAEIIKNKEEAAAAQEEAANLKELIEEQKKTIEELQNKIESIQAGNRGSDMEGELPDPDDYKKNLSDYIASKM